MSGRVRRWLPWAALLVVLGVTLAVGARSGGGRPTVESRTRSLASELRCPTCRSQSMLESDAVAARAGRDEIRRRVRAGESDAEIRAYFVSTYPDILLNPEGGGVAGLVWAVPVFVVVCALAGLVVAFRRWRPDARVRPTDEDRALVERALEQ